MMCAYGVNTLSLPSEGVEEADRRIWHCVIIYVLESTVTAHYGHSSGLANTIH